jgi:3-oxoacyl-[acyl-carrier protein] reductase
VEIDGKVAVVTGSSSGIGRATAELLASLGAQVVVNYARSASDADEVVEGIRASGGAAHAVQADVRDDAQCRALIQSAVDTYGALHILVNNAAMTRFIPHEDLEAVTDEVWDELLGANLRGPFNCIRAAAPHMRAAGAGAVVNVASVAGIYGGGSSIPYGASKAAVLSLTRLLAKVLAPEIRVNAVAPALVETPWLPRGFGEDGYQAVIESEARRTPGGRIAKPEECADTIVSLIRHNDFVTGQTIVIDNGRFL